MTEQHFTITIDLPESRMQELLGYCRKHGMTVPEVGNLAIAEYLKPAPEPVKSDFSHISLD